MVNVTTSVQLSGVHSGHTGSGGLPSSLNRTVCMYRVAAPSSSSTTRAQAQAQPAVLAAVEWVASDLTGSSPDVLDFIAAVNAGLVRLGDPCSVTAEGWAVLQRHRRWAR